MKTIDSQIQEVAHGWTLVPSYRTAFAYIHLPSADAVVLDIGCANGVYTPLWQRDGNQVIGADTDEKAIQIARQQQPNSAFHVLTETRLPFADNSLDVVIMLDAIEHVDDETLTLTEIWRVLRPGGRLILTTPYRNMLGDWMDFDNLFFIPLYNLKNWISGKAARLDRHRHYTTADLLAFCPDNFKIEVEEITGGVETAFLQFCIKMFGKSFTLLPATLQRRMLPLISSIQVRLKVRSQNSHFHRRRKALANKLNLVMRRVP